MAKKIDVNEIAQTQFEFMTDLDEIAHQEMLYELEMETMMLIIQDEDYYEDLDIEYWYSD